MKPCSDNERLVAVWERSDRAMRGRATTCPGSACSWTLPLNLPGRLWTRQTASRVVKVTQRRTSDVTIAVTWGQARRVSRTVSLRNIDILQVQKVMILNPLKTGVFSAALVLTQL